VPPRVTVLGDALLDVRATPAAPLRPGGDVPASIALGPGGQGANLAVRLARRGVRTRLVCRVAEDPAGDLIRRAIVADGVKLTELAAPSTGAVVVVLDASGERTMLSQRVPLMGPDLPVADELAADWLVVSGYVLTEGNPAVAVTGASSRRVVAGCSLDSEQAGAWLALARSLRPHLVVLNVEEARVLGGRDEPADLSRGLGHGLNALVVVTDRSGATASTDEGTVRTLMERVDLPLDTTGAGDAFTAGLVAALLDAPWPPPRELLARAMRSAGELASAVTGVAGAQGRVPGEHGA
jgi:ribokinase